MLVPPGIETLRFPATKIGETAACWKVAIYGREFNIPKSTGWLNQQGTHIDISVYMVRKKGIDLLRPPRRQAAHVQPQQVRRSEPRRRNVIFDDPPPPEKWNEVSEVLKHVPSMDPDKAVTNPQLSRSTGIAVGNLSRSRFKLYGLGYVDTIDFKGIFLTPLGKQMQGRYIYFDNKDFPAANKRWTARKKRYNRLIQRGLFDDEE
jgi:hypothetical protein